MITSRNPTGAAGYGTLRGKPMTRETGGYQTPKSSFAAVPPPRGGKTRMISRMNKTRAAGTRY